MKMLSNSKTMFIKKNKSKDIYKDIFRGIPIKDNFTFNFTQFNRTTKVNLGFRAV
jgi:hypothetical protein